MGKVFLILTEMQGKKKTPNYYVYENILLLEMKVLKMYVSTAPL